MICSNKGRIALMSPLSLPKSCLISRVSKVAACATVSVTSIVCISGSILIKKGRNWLVSLSTLSIESINPLKDCAKPSFSRSKYFSTASISIDNALCILGNISNLSIGTIVFGFPCCTSRFIRDKMSIILLIAMINLSRVFGKISLVSVTSFTAWFNARTNLEFSERFIKFWFLATTTIKV